MAKTTDKKTTNKRTAKQSKTVAVSPFDEVATPNAVDAVKPSRKRTATKKTKTVAEPAKETAKKAVSKPVSEMTVKPNHADAFSEPVGSIANEKPAKKQAKRKTVTAVSKKRVSITTTPVMAKAAAAASASVGSAFEEIVEVEFVPVDKRGIGDNDAAIQIDENILDGEPDVELSPVFMALADVTLPDLVREDRAQLLMQSPTRIYFYWSVRKDPFSIIEKVFDGGTNYSLVVKLTELNSGREEIHRADAAGNWWFAVEPNGRYQAEIGFYAVGRPYFRIVYSNVVETPRRSPSPRRASEAEWSVNADKFAEVLDVSGFKRDAYDVAIAGDDAVAADDVTAQAFRSFLGGSSDLNGVASDEMRYAMLALAGGMPLESLESRISSHLFAILSANAGSATSGRASATLSEYFEFDEAEFTEEEFGSAVFGASRVNFPSTVRSKRLVPKYSPRYNPVSSHSIG